MDQPDRIVGAKVSSPLVVGLGDGETILASDIPAVLQRTRTVIPVEEGQVVELGPGGVVITDFDGNTLPATPMEVDWDVARAQKSGYDDFMLKEIYEQPAAIRDTLVGRVGGAGHLALDELRVNEDLLRRNPAELLSIPKGRSSNERRVLTLDQAQLLFDSFPLRERLGRAGRATVERQYSWELIGRNMVELYREVINVRALQKEQLSSSAGGGLLV